MRHGYADKSIQASRSTRKKGGWRDLRRHRLELYPDCQLRYPGCTTKATTVHLDPALDGNHLLANLDNTLSACLHCHSTRCGL